MPKSTPYPKAGDISGRDNYKHWYHYVRKKHKIKARDVCVTSLAAPQHALRVAKLCGWDFWHNPAMLPNKYKAIYLVGCFPEHIEENAKLFLDFESNRIRDSKILIHWIGTDVLNMHARIPYLQSKVIREMFKSRNAMHLVQSKQNAEEMRELGFEVTHMPLPVEPKTYGFPLPKNFTVACYDHGGADQKWHKWLVLALAKSMPDVDWLFYGTKHAVGAEKNLEWIGYVPIQEVIQKSSCLIRLTVHDGYPVAPIEFIYSGRRVILNVPDMPFMDFVDLGAVKESRFVEIKKLLIKTVRQVQDEIERGKSLNISQIKEYYDNFLNPERFKATVTELLNGNSKI